MIIVELVFLSIITTVNGILGRCYLCSQETLAECVGNNQPDASIYRTTVLQYYTEPCNGQCVLFRNENRSIVRGCSWTYGHMTPKSIGWHEISPGIKAYFCNSNLCNNGTYEQVEKSTVKKEVVLSPQQLFLLAGNNPSHLQFGGSFPRQLRQCYSCTARFQGCGEFLDPHYASKYIRSCPTSCIIFRNPNDLHLITRDCSLYWPQVHAKSGLHKLFGSDAFFCQESLCNGISFDLIMGIFHHQLSAAIFYPPIRSYEITSTRSTSVRIESTTLSNFINSTEYLENNHTIMEDENSTSTIESEEDWLGFNSTTTLEHLSVDDLELDVETDDEYTLSPSTPMINFLPLIPYYLLNNHAKNQLLEYLKPLVIPSLSWMLNMTAQNKSDLPNSTTKSSDTTYEYCKNKQCHHGGRLNSDCFCICLPTFTGDNCETVLCEEEPPDTCSFILEHECQTNDIRYLCPIFCQLDICLSHQT